ncbi:hypothetical protein CEXT_569391 [Caerostris extrusa]|uniref:Uncharacterized protein n=1 Tax=Caerostris extrusa TaxID=172846 RepID=A0AAV4X3W1_CAEEX|nr:hypothetical protein CEXT_569391 [Caerostris extrusa]
MAFVDNYFAEKDAGYYLDGLKRWEYRWEQKACILKCIKRIEKSQRHSLTDDLTHKYEVLSFDRCCILCGALRSPSTSGT